MTTAPRARRRTANPAAAASPAPSTGGLVSKLGRVYALKVAADEAKAAYEKERKTLLADMTTAKRTEVELPADGNRPAVKAKIMEKSTSSIDVAAFQKLVTTEEFIEAASVTHKAASKFLGTAALDKITTTSKSAPSLDIRALGARKD